MTAPFFAARLFRFPGGQHIPTAVPIKVQGCLRMQPENGRGQCFPNFSEYRPADCIGLGGRGHHAEQLPRAY